MASLFRKSALDRLSSPEQLDQLMRITNPQGWLALLTLALLLLGAALWSYWGSIPTLSQGRGLLLPSGGFRGIPATASGQVVDVRFTEGDLVAAGAIVARILPSDPEAHGRIEVLSPYAGRVAQMKTRVGAIAQVGDVLLNLCDDRAALELIAFLPLDQGKKIQPGLEVHAIPSTVNQQRYGYLLGSVRTVSRYAATASEMRQFLGSEELAQTFLKGEGYQSTPLKMEVSLQANSETASGYQWSSESGPPFVLSAGTVCAVEVVTGDVRPIHLILPWLLRRFGAEAPP